MIYSTINKLAFELEDAMSKDEQSDPNEFVNAVIALETLKDALSQFLETLNNA